MPVLPLIKFLQKLCKYLNKELVEMLVEFVNGKALMGALAILHGGQVGL